MHDFEYPSLIARAVNENVFSVNPLDRDRLVGSSIDLRWTKWMPECRIFNGISKPPNVCACHFLFEVNLGHAAASAKPSVLLDAAVETTDA